MKRKLVSLTLAIGALSGVIVALTVLTGKVGSLIRVVADEWHALKESENVNEMGGDIARAAMVVWHGVALISWQAWATLAFTIIVVAWGWDRLIARPRQAEKNRIISELSVRFSRGNQGKSGADRHDA